MTISVFNTSTGNAKCLFLDENQGVSIQRFDDPLYPEVLKAFKRQLEFFWTPYETPLDEDRANFQKFNEIEEHVVISNIKRQIMLDSIMGRAPDLVFGPAISDPTLEALVKIWSFSEVIHSLSYTHIVQNSFNNPKQVLDTVLDIKEITDCSDIVTEHYDRCIKTVEDFYNGKATRAQAAKEILISMHIAHALEGIRFQVSFACSFYFADIGKMPGLGNIIKQINRDETNHMRFTRVLLRYLAANDPDFTAASNDPEVINIVKDIWAKSYHQEKDWNRYLCSKGELPGLNVEALDKYLLFLFEKRVRSLGIGTTESILGVEAVKENPFPWINKYNFTDETQNAPQEINLVEYTQGALDSNGAFEGLDDINI